MNDERRAMKGEDGMKTRLLAHYVGGLTDIGGHFNLFGAGPGEVGHAARWRDCPGPVASLLN